jgi:demethylspheroidene O-methyltransferase
VNARGLLSLLFHADKALDLVGTALELGVLDRLDAGPIGLPALCELTGAVPLRMYKFLDGLESLGLVERHQPEDALASATYRSREPIAPAARAVLGRDSVERDRDGYPWREIRGHLAEVLRGRRSSSFAWPPSTDAEVAAFEASMAHGCPPLVEALSRHAGVVFGSDACRWLDVGGGDGAVACGLLRRTPGVHADVFNLPSVAPLVTQRARAENLTDRVGFVGGDFLAGDLPAGYGVVSFVRVLHDWPAEVARQLIERGRRALVPGGRLVVCEEFRDADRLAVQFFWTYFLVGADSCVSRLRETSWYELALLASGFTDVRVLGDSHGAADLIVARRGS